MSNICKSCSQEISWDAKKREALHIRGPINLDGTMHQCMKREEKTQAQATQKTEIVTGHMNEDKISQLEKRLSAVESWIKKLSESYVMNHL